MLKIYHNPRCKKSRAGLQYLQKKGLNPEIVLYLKENLSEKDIARLLMKLNISAFDLIRTQEAIYKKEYKGLNLSEEEWIKVIVTNPKLMKRPIVEIELKAVWGDPAEEIENIL